MSKLSNGYSVFKIFKIHDSRCSDCLSDNYSFSLTQRYCTPYRINFGIILSFDYNIHLMYGPEGPQLVLLSRESLMFPGGADIKCFVIYLDFPFNNRSKTSGAGNNCGIVSWSGYI